MDTQETSVGKLSLDAPQVSIEALMLVVCDALRAHETNTYTRKAFAISDLHCMLQYIKILPIQLSR